MSAELYDAYSKLDDELREAIKKRVNGKGPPGLAATRVQALDAYMDTPWGWSPIMHSDINKIAHSSRVTLGFSGSGDPMMNCPARISTMSNVTPPPRSSCFVDGRLTRLA